MGLWGGWGLKGGLRGLGFRGLGFRGFRGFRGLGVGGLGFRVQGSGFRFGV